MFLVPPFRKGNIFFTACGVVKKLGQTVTCRFDKIFYFLPFLSNLAVPDSLHTFSMKL